MTMTFREAVDIRIAQLQGHPVDAAMLDAALQVIQSGHVTPKPRDPEHAAAAIVTAGRVTLAPILVVDFYRGAA